VTQTEESRGRVIITWSQWLEPTVLAPIGMMVTDFDTGQRLNCVRKVIIADCDRANVVAELTMLCGDDGEPAIDGTPIAAGPDGRPLEKTFTYDVVQMQPLVYLNPETTCACPVMAGGWVSHFTWCRRHGGDR
jgi:hypothetical protein